MADILSSKILFVGLCALAGSAFAVNGVDQLDEADRQEFIFNLARASACSKDRDFQCASNALTQARKFANGSRDLAALKAAAESVEVMRQMSVQDDATSKYQAERAQLNARSAQSEREIVQRRQAAVTSAERANALQRQSDAEKANQERQSPQADISVNAYIQQKGAEAAAVLANANSQVSAAINESNRVRALQAAEQERARAERHERELERRSELDRQRASRTARVGSESQRDQERAKVEGDRAREPELSREKQKQEAAATPTQDLAAVPTGRDSGAIVRSAPVQDAQRPGTAESPDDKGCFIPQRQPPECVVAEGRWARGTSGEYRVKYTNNCRARVFHYYAIEMKNGKWDTGSHGIPSGSSLTWWTSDGTGRFAHTYTGSTRPGNDWVCTDRDPAYEEARKRLSQ